MKSKISSEIRKVSGFPPKVIKKQSNVLLLPTPETVRQRAALDKWRERFWWSRHKYFSLLDPQYRELIRKMAFSMEESGRPEMAGNLTRAIFSIWFLTGSVEKLEEFIAEVFNGSLFLLNEFQVFLLQNTPADLSKAELIARLLLYNPRRHRDGCCENAESKATPFLSWMGTLPKVRPWIKNWFSEMDQIRGKAAAEIGKEAADALWTEVCGATRPHKARESKDKADKMTKKSAYW